MARTMHRAEGVERREGEWIVQLTEGAVHRLLSQSIDFGPPAASIVVQVSPPCVCVCKAAGSLLTRNLGTRQIGIFWVLIIG